GACGRFWPAPARGPVRGLHRSACAADRPPSRRRIRVGAGVPAQRRRDRRAGAARQAGRADCIRDPGHRRGGRLDLGHRPADAPRHRVRLFHRAHGRSAGQRDPRAVHTAHLAGGPAAGSLVSPDPVRTGLSARLLGRELRRRGIVGRLRRAARSLRARAGRAVRFLHQCAVAGQRRDHGGGRAALQREDPLPLGTDRRVFEASLRPEPARRRVLAGLPCAKLVAGRPGRQAGTVGPAAALARRCAQGGRAVPVGELPVRAVRHGIPAAVPFRSRAGCRGGNESRRSRAAREQRESAAAARPAAGEPGADRRHDVPAGRRMNAGNSVTNLALVNNVDHRDLRVITERSATYGDDVMFVTTFPFEFRSVQAFYPILFHRDANGDLYPVALFGVKDGEDLFLDDDWGHAHHVPAMIRTPSFLEEMASLLETIYEGYVHTRAFVNALEQNGLIESVTFDITLNDGSRNQLLGFYTIEEEKVQQLSAETLWSFSRQGFLMPLFMVLASTVNMRSLVEMKNRRLEGR